jgi:hypothetical protein
MLTKRSALLALAFCLALLGDSWGQSQQPPPSKEKLNQPQQTEPHATQQLPAIDQRGTEQAPLIVKALPSPQANEKAAEAATKQPEKPTSDWSVNDVIASFAAFFALIQAVALSVTIIVLVRTSQRQLRAYVLVETAYFAQPKTKTGKYAPWSIHVTFKNFGQTPAYSTVIKITKILSAPKPDDIFLPTPENAEILPTSIIPPGEIHTVRIGGLNNGYRDFVAARNTGKKAYVWGRADYLDIFGRPHFLTFQMICRFEQIHQFAFCEKGNGTNDQFRRWWNWWRSA